MRFFVKLSSTSICLSLFIFWFPWMTILYIKTKINHKQKIHRRISLKIQENSEDFSSKRTFGTDCTIDEVMQLVKQASGYFLTWRVRARFWLISMKEEVNERFVNVFTLQAKKCVSRCFMLIDALLNKKTVLLKLSIISMGNLLTEGRLSSQSQFDEVWDMSESN